MAKKKKKKISAARPAQSPGEIDLAKKNADKTSLASPPSKKSNGPLQKGATVSLWTCVGGMGLCLALGLYLGTLIPMIREEGTAARIPPEIPMSAPNVSEKPRELPATGENDRKQARLLEETARHPGDARVWTDLGNFYFDAMNFGEAIKAYEKALAINPDNPDVLTDLGIMYRETDQFGKALDNFRKASSIDPAHQNSLYNEGIVQAADLHNAEAAIQAWEKLLRINPDARSPEGVPVSEQIKKLRK